MFKDRIAYKKYEWFTDKFKTDTLIETGTFWGESSIVFSKFHTNVITCEIDAININLAIANFKRNGFSEESISYTKTYNLKVFKFVNSNKNIWLIKGSSELVLETIFLGELNYNFETPFTFFLDAHWDTYWPLIDELRLIGDFKLSDSKIIIHDFKVPGFDDWGYDSHQNQDLDYDYINEYLFRINPYYLPFFPDKVGDGQHGRGILYAVPPNEIDFEDYIKLNRGNPPIKINESLMDLNQIHKLKNNYYTFNRKNNTI